jgi:hypothetical protein
VPEARSSGLSVILLRGVGQNLFDRQFELSLGLADRERGHTGTAMSDEAIKPAWLCQGIVKLDVNQVFDGFAELFRMYGRVHCTDSFQVVADAAVQNHGVVRLQNQNGRI